MQRWLFEKAPVPADKKERGHVHLATGCRETWAGSNKGVPIHLTLGYTQRERGDALPSMLPCKEAQEDKVPDPLRPFLAKSVGIYNSSSHGAFPRVPQKAQGRGEHQSPTLGIARATCCSRVCKPVCGDDLWLCPVPGCHRRLLHFWFVSALGCLCAGGRTSPLETHCLGPAAAYICTYPSEGWQFAETQGWGSFPVQIYVVMGSDCCFLSQTSPEELS